MSFAYGREPAEALLTAPGLLPLACLGRTDDRTATLRQVAEQIEDMGDRRTQGNLSASTAILAGLILEKDLIRRILRREIMQESVIYLRLLSHQLGRLPEDLMSQVNA